MTKKVNDSVITEQKSEQQKIEMQKTIQTTKEKCTNYDKMICDVLNCSDCGMNPLEFETLKSENLNIVPMVEINQNLTGKLIDIIDSPFTDSPFYTPEDKFLVIECNSIIKHINQTTDLKRIKNDMIGKIIKITLIDITKSKKGTFKLFDIKVSK